MLHLHLITVVAGIVACSSSMAEAVRRARSYAKAKDTVVLTGPTGSGKSHLARLIHEWSGRGGRLVEISARELHPTLAHAQLFGHERGAFTGALERREGIFAQAGAGHVVLDDGQLLKKASQALLLRVLDSGMYRLVGGQRDVPLQARLLVGLQRDPDALVRAGVLLPDLRYRLAFFEIRLEPLCERREDVGPLAAQFLDECARERGGAILAPASDLVSVLELAPWPGNVRELKAAIRFADWTARESGEREVRVVHLPPQHQRSLVFDPRSDHETKERLVDWALWKAGGHLGDAAAFICAHRNTVTALLRERPGRRRGSGLHKWSPSPGPLVEEAATLP